MTNAEHRMSLRDLRRYRPPRRDPVDFDDFWADTLARSRAAGSPVCAVRVETPIEAVRTWDVTFSGWRGQPVRAWLHLPAVAAAPVACVVEFSGYGQGRGLPHERMLYALAGMGHLIVDARGQSGGERRCDTPDDCPFPIEGTSLMTRGIATPDSFYLTRLIVDSVRAVDAVRDLPGLDVSRVAAAGVSQGGGLALAAAAFCPELSALCCDVPFMSSFWHGVPQATEGPYVEVRERLAARLQTPEEIWRTLSYADGVNMAARATVPALFSVGMLDVVCPPQAVFAAYNHYKGAKDIAVYAYNGHEGGQGDQDVLRLRFLRDALSFAHELTQPSLLALDRQLG